MCKYDLPSGSSAITGTIAALRLGYKKVLLCGCPLEGKAPEGNPYEAFQPGWVAKKDIFEGRVKSVSGWTKKFLGGQNDWLQPLPLNKIFSARGDLVASSPFCAAYIQFARGGEQNAREQMVAIHKQGYALHGSDKLNEILSALDIMDDTHDTFIERGIQIRVDRYLTRFKKLIQYGYGECSFQIVVRKTELGYILESCGFHKIAAMIALGYKEIPNIEVLGDD